MPLISVILATRDRPALFAEALRSVLTQTFDDKEIVVVNDGSDEQHRQAYDVLLDEATARLGDRLRHHWLIRRPNGHGGAYSRNFGVEQANGCYVTFLDDDDCWTDPEHLARVARVIGSDEAERPVDLMFANQEAYVGASRLPGPIWLEGLAGELERAGRKAGPEGAFRVGVRDLMAARGFCHLNTLTVQRDLFQAIGGLDETIRWEHDRDFYLRTIDCAAEMRYMKQFIARHNVPSPKARASTTTNLPHFLRYLDQSRVMDNVVNSVADPQIRRYAFLHKGYALKRLAESLAADGRVQLALPYAREALGLHPTFKWAAFTALLALRAMNPRASGRLSRRASSRG